MSVMLAPLALLLPAMATQQDAPGDQAGAVQAAAAEARAVEWTRAAEAAAARIARVVAEAPAKGVVPPRALYTPNLEEFYPPAALRAHQQGVVRLRCTLTVAGRFEACVLETSSGAQLLDAAAFEVAKYAHYSPRIVDGVPQEMRAVLPVRWVIE